MPAPLRCPKTVERLTLERLPYHVMRLCYRNKNGTFSEILEEYQFFRHVAFVIGYYRNYLEATEPLCNSVAFEIKRYTAYTVVVVCHSDSLAIGKFVGNAAKIILNRKEIDFLLDMSGAFEEFDEGLSKLQWVLQRAENLPDIEPAELNENYVITTT